MRYKFYNLKVDLNRPEKENYGQQSEEKLQLTLTAIENRSFGSCNFIERKAPRSDCNSCVKQSNKDNIYNVSLFSCSQQNFASFANHRCLGVGFEGETNLHSSRQLFNFTRNHLSRYYKKRTTNIRRKRTTSLQSVPLQKAPASSSYKLTMKRFSFMLQKQSASVLHKRIHFPD